MHKSFSDFETLYGILTTLHYRPTWYLKKNNTYIYSFCKLAEIDFLGLKLLCFFPKFDQIYPYNQVWGVMWHVTCDNFYLSTLSYSRQLLIYSRIFLWTIDNWNIHVKIVKMSHQKTQKNSWWLGKSESRDWQDCMAVWLR